MKRNVLAYVWLWLRLASHTKRLKKIAVHWVQFVMHNLVSRDCSKLTFYFKLFRQVNLINFTAACHLCNRCTNITIICVCLLKLRWEKTDEQIPTKCKDSLVFFSFSVCCSIPSHLEPDWRWATDTSPRQCPRWATARTRWPGRRTATRLPSSSVSSAGSRWVILSRGPARMNSRTTYCSVVSNSIRVKLTFGQHLL